MGRVIKGKNQKTQILEAVLPQILKNAEAAMNVVKPTVHRSAEKGPHLQDSFEIEERRGPISEWGCSIHFGYQTFGPLPPGKDGKQPVDPEVAKALAYEFGNQHQDGERPLLKIRNMLDGS